MLHALLLLCACHTPATTTTTPTPTVPDASVVVTVNGVPVHDEDINFAISRASHSKEAKTSTPRTLAVLDTVIRQELVYQKAVSLGLDQDPAYQAKVRAIDARANAEKREAIAAIFYKKEIDPKATVTEAEARAFWEKNEANLHTEVHLLMILRRTEADILKAQAALQAGRAFDDVAGEGLAKASLEGKNPWDLGWLRWIQVPDALRATASTIEVGKNSDVIEGENGRHWIIQVVERRTNPKATFETSQKAIINTLTQEKAFSLRDKAFNDLRAAAAIVKIRDPKEAEAASRKAGEDE